MNLLDLLLTAAQDGYEAGQNVEEGEPIASVEEAARDYVWSLDKDSLEAILRQQVGLTYRSDFLSMRTCLFELVLGRLNRPASEDKLADGKTPPGGSSLRATYDQFHEVVEGSPEYRGGMDRIR